MVREVLEDLIRQVQQETRTESGLAQYDPTENLLPLPPISETVSSFDPSPSHLRCKNCNGRFLRGLQSVLCVYCGRPNDVPHDPICFKDTVAYRWLLESLHLDGSEIVGPPIERGDSEKGRSTPDNEVHLSDLLNFKISWSAEEQQRENNVSCQILEEGSYLKFSGIDLDNFYQSRTLDATSKPEEHKVIASDVVTAEIKVVSTNNLSFFENVPSSEVPVQSAKDKDNDDFSGWEADFHSANSGNDFDGSRSFELSVNSAVAPTNDDEMSKQTDPLSVTPVDISSHMDTVFGSMNNLNNVKDDSTASPSIGDWTSHDTWSNFSPGDTLETKQPDPTVTMNDAFPSDNLSNVDLSYQLDSMFGSKQEFSAGKEKSDFFTSGPSNSDWTSDDLWNSSSSKASHQTEAPVTTIRLTDALPQDKTNNPSTSFDWFQADQWQKNTKEPANNVVSRDDAISDWDELASSIPVQDFLSNAPTGTLKQSIGASGSTSESFLFNSENDLEEMDFGSFSQADTSQSLSGQESASTELNNIGFAGSDRAIHVKSDAERSLEQSDTGTADVDKVSTHTREDVEMLMSQMHDLSFMLDDNLSIPRQPNGFNNFSTG